MPRRSVAKNGAQSTISNSGVSVSSGATSIPVLDGSVFPTTSGGPFTIKTATGECIRVLTRVGSVFTSCSRGLPEGSAAAAISDGSVVTEILGAADIADIEDYVPPIDASDVTSGTFGAARLPLATTGAFGAVKPDGTSITISAGVLSSPSAGTTLAGDTDVSMSGLAAGQHLAYNGAAWFNANPSKLQLDYAAATDLMTGGTLTAATWTDVGTNQTFTVDDANSTVEITVGGSILVGNQNTANVGLRIVIDSAGTPINQVLGGSYVASATSIENQLNGCGAYKRVLSAGSHTIKVQVKSDAANSCWCRASTKPDSEGLRIQVFEIKR